MHHADQGSHDASLACGRRLRATGLVQSMGSRGDGADYAAAERVFATLAIDLLARHRFPNRNAARLALCDAIEGVSNTHRRHSALGYLSPAADERRWTAQTVVPSRLTVHQTGGTPQTMQTYFTSVMLPAFPLLTLDLSSGVLDPPRAQINVLGRAVIGYSYTVVRPQEP